MNKPKVLIISNTLDFGTDYITYSLESRNISYLRINRDCFDRYRIDFNIQTGILEIEVENEMFILSEEILKSIYFRAPVYLRDNYQPDLTTIEQLYRTQWTAFIKNLVYFENVLWMNNPTMTYKAENKLLQLKVAKELGLHIPDTIVTNSNKRFQDTDKMIVMKSIDTALFKKSGQEAFVYTNVMSERDLMSANLTSLPIMTQEFLNPKIDIRVTIVGEEIFAVKILKENCGIEGDWRMHREGIVFESFDLPKEISEVLLKLNQRFNLKYSAIDLAISKGKYYFVEINPTGEWAWLVDNAGISIDQSICNMLEGGNA